MAERVYRKLVRDKIPDIIRGKGEVPVTRALGDEEYLEALHQKLSEELTEYLRADSREERLMEFCDLCEVMAAAAAAQGFSAAEIQAGRLKKNEKNGAFGRRIYLEKVLSGGEES